MRKTSEATAKSVEELQAQVDELQQKLNMAEYAIDDKDGELRAVQEALKAYKGGGPNIDLREAEKEKEELISKHEEDLSRYT